MSSSHFSIVNLWPMLSLERILFSFEAKGFTSQRISALADEALAGWVAISLASTVLFLARGSLGLPELDSSRNWNETYEV